MRALWWFKDNSIAGMARPGFNATHFFDLPFDEGIFLGWIGQFSQGPVHLALLRKHLETYAPRVFPFFRLTPETGPLALKIFEHPSGIEQVMARVAERTRAFRDYLVHADHLHFSLNEVRVKWEIAQLKKMGVRRIVSLTERHHSRDLLAAHFDLHHLGIEDLNAPSLEQVHDFAEVIQRSMQSKEILAVHCLAGIGRTSTMLMAAHLTMGVPMHELQALIAQRNPSFVLAGPQAEFLRTFSK